MSLDLVGTLRLASESEITDREPTVIVLVDRRGHRMLVPIGRHRPQRGRGTATSVMPAFVVDAAYSSGTIH